MSVLVDALSVIVRQSTLHAKYPGGVRQYAADCPNRTYCADSHLTRVGFMATADVRGFVGHLERLGLEYVRDGACADIVVVDQDTGPIIPCDWLHLGSHADGYVYAWLVGTQPGTLGAPANWSPEKSRSLRRIDERDIPARMFALGVEGTVEAHLDLKTGQILYAPPAGSVVPPESAEQDRPREASPTTTRKGSTSYRQPTLVKEPVTLSIAGSNTSISAKDLKRFHRAILFDRVAIASACIAGLFHVPLAFLCCVPIGVYARRVRYLWRIAPDKLMRAGPGASLIAFIDAARTSAATEEHADRTAVTSEPAPRWWIALCRAVLGPVVPATVLYVIQWIGYDQGVTDAAGLPFVAPHADVMLVLVVLVYSGLLKHLTEEHMEVALARLDPVSRRSMGRGR